MVDILTLISYNKLCSRIKKDRYSFNEDKTLIRANQGHSIDVTVSLTEVIPPQFFISWYSYKVCKKYYYAWDK